MEQVIVATAINVCILSSMYILTAVGFGLLFSMLGILNFAHGAIYMIGGYIGFEISVRLGFNPWAATLLSVLVMGAFGMIMEKFFFRPSVGNFNRTVMVCIAVTIVAQTAINILEGGKIQALPAFVEGVFKAGPMSVSYQRIVTFGMGIALLGVVSWFVNRTKWGVQMQAISQNMTAALLQGINVHRISMIAVALGCGLAALAGCLMGAYLQLTPFMGDSMLTKVLILVVLAGVGSIGGIFITGLVLGGLDAVFACGGRRRRKRCDCRLHRDFSSTGAAPRFFGHEMVGGPENEASAPTSSTAGRARRWAVPSPSGRGSFSCSAYCPSCSTRPTCCTSSLSPSSTSSRHRACGPSPFRASSPWPTVPTWASAPIVRVSRPNGWGCRPGLPSPGLRL